MKQLVRLAVGSAIAAALAAGCGKVEPGAQETADATVESPDAEVIDAAPPADASTLGTKEDPAASCQALLDALGPKSGLYWVKHPEPGHPAIQVYCEQTLGGGGWAMLYNSVFRLDGTTTAFWNILRADRFVTKGTAAPGENYYQGSLYPVGREYLDTITDVAGKTAVAIHATAKRIDTETMKFEAPVFLDGNQELYDRQFAAGWSSPDQDGDMYDGTPTTPPNCAVFYANVTQHYLKCWMYSLGADAELPYLDGGVGPHVHIRALGDLGLVPQPDGGGEYSRVQRIARFTRWDR